MREVRAGVWHWEARHPEWNEQQGWWPLVSSYAIDDGARLLLFDPVAPPPDGGDPSPVDGTVLREGDRLQVGVAAFPGMEPNDLVLWVESHRALVAGDTLQDRGNGLQFLGDLPNNLPAELATEQVLERMRPLLALPVEVVLLTHGAPTEKAPLDAALATSPS